MSRYFNGTSYWLREPSFSAVTAVPFTLATWATLASLGTERRFLNIGVTNSNSDTWFIGTSASNAVSAIARTTANAFALSSTTVGTANTWFHAAGVFSASNARAAYLNGGGKGTNTTDRTPSVTTDIISIGATPSGGAPLAGRMAHPAIWNVALTDAEIAMLAAGASPLQIRPNNLVRYWPNFGKEGSPTLERCAVSRRALNVTGSPSDPSEPPYPIWIHKPSRRIWVPSGVAAPQVVPAGLTEETDSALAVAKLKRKTVGLITETDSSLAVAKLKRRTVGLNTETDSSLAVAKYKVKAVGLNTETDAPLAVAKAKRYAVGLTAETDSALPVGSAWTIAVGLVSAVETALAVTKRIARSVGLVSETDTALPIDFATIVPIGAATETDSAFAVSKLKRKLVGLATEIDSARRVVIAATTSWGLKFPLIRPMVRNLIQSWRSRRFPWKEPF